MRLAFLGSFLLAALLVAGLSSSCSDQREPATKQESTLAPSATEVTAVSTGTATASYRGASEAAGRAVCAKYEGTPCYAGALFDAHLHVNVGALNVNTPTLIALLDRDGIAYAMGFFDTTGSEVSIQRNGQTALSVQRRIVPLLQPSHSGPTYLDGFAAPNGLRDLFLSALRPKGSFAGVGEMALYFPDAQAVTLKDSKMQEIFSALNEVGGIAMIHPRDQGLPTTMDEIRLTVETYANVTFVFHGHHSQQTFLLIEPLMATHENVFFSIDFPSWNVYIDPAAQRQSRPCSPCAGVFWSDALQRVGGTDIGTFQASVLQGGGPIAVAEKGASLALEKLSQHPDRIMWGTDRFSVWHFEPSVSETVVEISRLLIGRMPPEIQEKFAFGNAMRILGPFLSQ